MTRYLRGIMAWQRNFRRELYEEFLSPGGLPGLKETTLLDPQGWRHLTRSEVEFAAKYALWLSFRDWGNFFSWVVKAGVGEEDKKDAASSGQSPSLSNKDSGGVEPPLVTAAQLQDLTQRAGTQIRALASSEDLQGRLLSLGATSELKARLASLGSEGLHLTRDCLDEFLKGYEDGKGEQIREYLAEEAARKEKEELERGEQQGTPKQLQ